MSNIEKIIVDFIDKQDTSIISTIDKDGFPNTRAMLPPRKREYLKTFYFSTNTSSSKVSQYKNNPKAYIYFYDRFSFRGVMLVGTMEILEDYETKKMIWKEGDTMYYPKGINDPDYCVLRFTVLRGRYYSNLKSEDFNIT